jgi:hypothetical protein
VRLRAPGLGGPEHQVSGRAGRRRPLSAQPLREREGRWRVRARRRGAQVGAAAQQGARAVGADGGEMVQRSGLLPTAHEPGVELVRAE